MCHDSAAGVTLVNTSVRRKPNAFNFLHQCELLMATGMTGDSSRQSLDVGLSGTDHFFNLESAKLKLLFEQICCKTYHPCNVQDLENASAFATAYQIGKLEAGACANLLKNISPKVKDKLKDLVRTLQC